jgi:uncharacterized ion transporter superfamily protein YfcC
MNRKNDKLIIVLISMAVFLIFSWVLKISSVDTAGFLTEGSIIRLGLFELISMIFYSFQREIDVVLFILMVGGSYGVLKNTKSYRKLVDNTSKLIKDKEHIAFAIVTLIMGLYVSISSELLVLFILVPFIVSVFLRRGLDNLTAVSAAFGGIFIGFLGQTFGTYGFKNLLDSTGVIYTDFIWQKWVIFGIAYILYNVFAIYHLTHTKRKDNTDDDMYCPEKLVENKVPKRKRTKVWPTLVVAVISLIVILLGYIAWNDSFDIVFFSELHTSFQGLLKVNDVALPSTFIGSSISGLGEWKDFVHAIFVFFIATFVISLLNKMSISDFIKYYGRGAKKISKVAIIYALSYTLLYLFAISPWPATIIHSVFGTDSFNLFTLFIAAFLILTVCVDPGYSSAVYGPFLTYSFADCIVVSTIVWRIGGALASLIVPTSFILLMALTYADISYTKWVKYIWKFVVSFAIVSLIFLSIIVYM